MSTLKYQIYTCFVVVVVAFNSVSSEFTECDRYCDDHGQMIRDFVCHPPNKHCCGSRNIRYCCNDSSLDVSGKYPVPPFCPGFFFLLQWRVIIGLLASLVIMLLFAACCYYCCGPGYPSSLSRRRSLRRRRVSSDEPSTLFQTDQSRTPGRPPVFDPESPNAFTPPSYESLPKDPPKYAELFDPPSYSATGQENPAFVRDGVQHAPNESIPLVTSVLTAANKTQEAGRNGGSQTSTAPRENQSENNASCSSPRQSSRSGPPNASCTEGESTPSGASGQSTSNSDSSQNGSNRSQSERQTAINPSVQSTIP